MTTHKVGGGSGPQDFDDMVFHNMIGWRDRSNRIEIERDALRAENARLLAVNARLREALQWFVDNDETNEGDTPMPEHGDRTWNEINAYWIEGLNAARAALEVKP
jgi:hypothetical protein